MKGQVNSKTYQHAPHIILKLTSIYLSFHHLYSYLHLSTYLHIYLHTICLLIKCVKIREQLAEVSSFHHVSLGNWTQIFSLGCKHLYWLSHLISPIPCTSLNKGWRCMESVLMSRMQIWGEFQIHFIAIPQLPPELQNSTNIPSGFHPKSPRS